MNGGACPRPWAGAGPLSGQFPIPWNGEKRILLAGRLACAVSPGPRQAFPRDQPPLCRNCGPVAGLQTASFPDQRLSIQASSSHSVPVPSAWPRRLLGTSGDPSDRLWVLPTCRQAEVKGRPPGSPEDNARLARPHPGEMTMWDLRLRGDHAD